MVSCESTLIENEPCAKTPRASVTRAVNVKLPVVVGEPLSTPAALRARPGGIVPAGCDHRSGAVPPLAARVRFTLPPWVASGSGLVVVIAGAAWMVIASAFDAVTP